MAKFDLTGIGTPAKDFDLTGIGQQSKQKSTPTFDLSGIGEEPEINPYVSSLASGLYGTAAGLSQAPAAALEFAATPVNWALKTAGQPQIEAPDWLGEPEFAKRWSEYAQELNTGQKLFGSKGIGLSDLLQKRDLPNAARWLTHGILTNAPSTIGSIAAVASGSAPVAASLIGGMVATQAGSSYGQTREMGMEPFKRGPHAAIMGGIEGVTEFLGDYLPLKHFAKQIYKEFGEVTAKKMFKTIAKKTLLQGLGEASEEVVAQAGQDLTDYAFDVNPDALTGMFDRMFEAGVLGGVTGVGIGGPSGVGIGMSHAKAVAQKKDAQIESVARKISNQSLGAAGASGKARFDERIKATKAHYLTPSDYFERGKETEPLGITLPKTEDTDREEMRWQTMQRSLYSQQQQLKDSKFNWMTLQAPEKLQHIKGIPASINNFAPGIKQLYKQGLEEGKPLNRPISQYFTLHPSAVIGKMSEDKSYWLGDKGFIGRDIGNLIYQNGMLVTDFVFVQDTGKGPAVIPRMAAPSTTMVVDEKGVATEVKDKIKNRSEAEEAYRQVDLGYKQAQERGMAFHSAEKLGQSLAGELLEAELVDRWVQGRGQASLPLQRSQTALTGPKQGTPQPVLNLQKMFPTKSEVNQNLLADLRVLIDQQGMMVSGDKTDAVKILGAINKSPLPQALKDIANGMINFVKNIKQKDVIPSLTSTKPLLKIDSAYDLKTDKIIMPTNLDPEKAVRVYLHELFHRGQERLFAAGGKDELMNVFQGAKQYLTDPKMLKQKGFENLAEFLKAYELDDSTPEGEFEMLLELAAIWSEKFATQPAETWWKRFIDDIVTWISRFMNIDLTEADVNNIVGRIVRLGGATAEEMQTVEEWKAIERRKRKKPAYGKLKTKHIVGIGMVEEEAGPNEYNRKDYADTDEAVNKIRDAEFQQRLLDAETQLSQVTEEEQQFAEREEDIAQEGEYDISGIETIKPRKEVGIGVTPDFFLRDKAADRRSVNETTARLREMFLKEQGKVPRDMSAEEIISSDFQATILRKFGQLDLADEASVQTATELLYSQLRETPNDPRVEALIADLETLRGTLGKKAGPAMQARAVAEADFRDGKIEQDKFNKQVDANPEDAQDTTMDKIWYSMSKDAEKESANIQKEKDPLAKSILTSIWKLFRIPWSEFNQQIWYRTAAFTGEANYSKRIFNDLMTTLSDRWVRGIPLDPSVVEFADFPEMTTFRGEPLVADPFHMAMIDFGLMTTVDIETGKWRFGVDPATNQTWLTPKQQAFVDAFAKAHPQAADEVLRYKKLFWVEFKKWIDAQNAIGKSPQDLAFWMAKWNEGYFPMRAIVSEEEKKMKGFGGRGGSEQALPKWLKRKEYRTVAEFINAASGEAGLIPDLNFASVVAYRISSSHDRLERLALVNDMANLIDIRTNMPVIVIGSEQEFNRKDMYKKGYVDLGSIMRWLDSEDIQPSGAEQVAWITEDAAEAFKHMFSPSDVAGNKGVQAFKTANNYIKGLVLSLYPLALGGDFFGSVSVTLGIPKTLSMIIKNTSVDTFFRGKDMLPEFDNVLYERMIRSTGTYGMEQLYQAQEFLFKGVEKWLQKDKTAGERFQDAYSNVIGKIPGQKWIWNLSMQMYAAAWIKEQARFEKIFKGDRDMADRTASMVTSTKLMLLQSYILSQNQKTAGAILLLATSYTVTQLRLLTGALPILEKMVPFRALKHPTANAAQRSAIAKNYQAHLVKGFIGSYAILILMNLLFAGKPPWENEEGHRLDLELPFEKDGKKTYADIPFARQFFALVKILPETVGKMAGFPYETSTLRWWKNKTAPLTRAGLDLYSNTDFSGREIRHPGASAWENLLRQTGHVGRGILPRVGGLSAAREYSTLIEYLSPFFTGAQVSVGVEGGDKARAVFEAKDREEFLRFVAQEAIKKAGPRGSDAAREMMERMRERKMISRRGGRGLLKPRTRRIRKEYKRFKRKGLIE